MSLQWSPDETPTCDPTPTEPLPITRGDRWVDYALIIGCLILLRVVWGIFAGVFPLD